MAQQTINIGAAPNDGTGDTIRDAYDKCNDNFDELYGLIRSEGNVSVSSGNNVITFSSPLASSSYSLTIWDVNGIGVSLVSQNASGFTLNSLGSGVINYIAILNN